MPEDAGKADGRQDFTLEWLQQQKRELLDTGLYTEASWTTKSRFPDT